MNIRGLFKKEMYYKSARICKEGADPDLLQLFMKAIKKSFSFTCKECSDWRLECEEQGKYILLTVSCRAFSNLEAEEKK